MPVIDVPVGRSRWSLAVGDADLIAHPERTESVLANPALADDFAERGSRSLALRVRLCFCRYAAFDREGF